jgi:WD40 repeat protein/DNA-binding SARP family transcriptional activator
MQISVLGPVEVTVGGRPVEVGAGKPRALLALLALHEGSTLTTDRLVADLWGEAPPPTAPKMVQLCVSQLRKTLPNGDGAAAIVTRGRGYELRLGTDELDARCFERLVAEGRPREALALWRGAPLADVAGEPFAAGEIRRLEELRLAAIESAIDDDLGAARHREVAAELDVLVAEEPLRERFHAQRMLALYRCGRQADALDAYRQARSALVEAIGIEPGPELRRLQEAILRQEPSLEAPAPELRRRVDAIAERTASDRAALRAAEDELAGDVVALHAARDRAQQSSGDGIVICPFKGLASFEVEDAAFYFGRERLVAEMVARLAGAPLLAVVGASGSGKSSALKAGLLPALADGVLPGSDGWALAALRPGEEPVRALEAATAAAARNGRLVIAVDQFEELFTACRNESRRATFVEALVAAVRDPRRRALVIAVLRADFYGYCAVYPELWRLLGANQVAVGPMGREELRRAIELPAQRAGLEVEPELTDALVAHVEGEPGALPLLSTSLLELWQHRDGRRLRFAAYEETGGVHGAIARLAEAAYRRLDANQRVAARAILLRLAGEGEGDAAVRARVPLDEFDDDAQPVLADLIDSRLLTTGNSEVEVAHEALLREWPRLRGWLEEDADGRRLHRHLRAAARDWDTRGRENGDLYRGSRLAAALDWAGGHDLELSATDRAFLGAGRAAGERAHRRLRVTLAVVAGLLVLALIAGVVALDERGSARDEAITAEAQQLGARALLDERPDRSLLLARQAVALDDTVRTRGNLLGALLRSPAATGVIRWDHAPILSAAVSPDGRALAVGDLEGQVALFDTSTRRHVATIEPASNEPGVHALAYSPDSRRLAVLYTSDPGETAEPPGGWRFLVALVDTKTRRVMRRMALPVEHGGAGVGFSPNGRTVDVTLYGANGAVWRYDAQTGRRSGAPVPVDNPGRLTYDPFQLWPQSPVMATSDGRRLLVGGLDGVTERDAASLRVLQRFPQASARATRTEPTAYALTPNGSTVAIGSDDGSVRLLDLTSGTLRTASGRHSAAVNDAIFTPDGRILVTTGQDGKIILWDARKAVASETLTGHARSAFSPQLADGGRTLYTASLDGSVLKWDLLGDQRLGERFPTGPSNDLSPRYALSSDGSLLAHGQSDGTVSVVNMQTLRQQRPPIAVVRQTGGADRGDVEGMAFVPGSHLVIVGGEYGTVSLVDADRGRVLRRLRGGPTLYRLPGKATDDPIWTPGVSADGRLFVTASKAGTVTLWSLPGGRALRRLRFPYGVSDSQLSPDGRWMTLQVLNREIVQDRLEIWDVRRNRRVAMLRPPSGVSFARFSPDGGYVAVGDLLGRVTVLSTATWEAVTRPLVASKATWASFAPDGRTLATGTTAGTVQLWAIPAGQAIGTPLPGLPDVGVTPIFTPDGTHVIAAYEQGRAYRWDIRPASLIRHACQVAGRRLTRAEWDEYLPGRPYHPAC